MDYSADCPDDIMIEIFKNLDLKSRLLASQTCQRWNRLLKDSRSFMEDVSIDDTSMEEESGAKILTSALIHIGKAKRLTLGALYLTKSPVPRLVQDGRLKIDTLCFICSNDLSESECLNQLLPSTIDDNGELSPSSITELDLQCIEKRQILICDWSRFSNLKYLRLDNILIDTSSKPPPKLKRLDLILNCDDDEEEEDSNVDLARFAFNTTITYLSTSLEELRLLFIFNLSEASCEKFLVAMKNRLPKLRRLCFQVCSFELSDVGGSFEKTMTNLVKEIKFIDCNGCIDFAQLFLRHCTLDILKIEALITDNTKNVCGSIDTYEGIEGIYNLAVLAKKRKSKFGLKLRFKGKTSPILQKFSVPVELSQTLVILAFEVLSSLEFLRRHFDCHTYEKLTKIKLISCKINDDILKRIAQLCPYLEKMRLCDCQEITENGLKSFLIYWEERKSMRLSIECLGSISIIGGLFGFFFKDGKGILDESRMMGEENENGETSSKRQKKSDGKRWMVIRKTFSINDKNQNGTRLIIWDQNKSIGDGDQKSLVIKDYDKDKLIKKLEI